MRSLRVGTPVLALAVVGALFVGGCHQIPRPAEAESPAQPAAPRYQSTAKVPRPLIFDPFATPFAVVEVADAPTCRLATDAGKWVAVPSAARPMNQRADRKAGAAPDPQQALRPRRLGRLKGGYCVYKWSDPKSLPSRQAFAAIHAVPDNALVAGSPGNGQAKAELPKSVSVPLLNTFAKQARGVGEATWRQALMKKSPPAVTGMARMPVRVAVVDATPHDLTTPDRSFHGFVVSRVIGSLLCDKVNDKACADQIRPYLALPMISATEADLAQGGFSGTFFQLADALGAALEDWDFQKEHLIINLSLGWDSIKVDGADRNVARIRSLLNQASCMGALIVAAAGNPTGVAGPVYPGAYEELHAPTAAECQQLDVPFHRSAGGAAAKSAIRALGPPYEPLLHAVGALDPLDQRLLADRRWAQPRLGALGLQVTVPGPPPMDYTPPFNGTSMSTAIVSGIAAALWSVLPNLDAASIMALVYQGGVELDGAAHSKRARTEYCLDGHFGTCEGIRVHRAYLCGALKAASKLLPGGTPPVCDPSPSTERPAWPNSTIAGAAPEPCRVSACGMPLNPMSNQLLSSVISHGGVAGCPGCTLTVIPESGAATLAGIPTPPDVVPGSVLVELDVMTWDSIDSYILNPTPVFNLPMGLPTMRVATTAAGATMTFWYNVGGDWIYDPPVGIRVLRKSL